MNNEIIGYKGFNKDLTCKNGFQYEIGKSYEMEYKPIICKRGFHFCKEIRDVFWYYPSNCRIYKVRAYGDISNRGSSYCTNQIEVLEEETVLSKEDRIRYAYANEYNLSDTELERLLKEDFVLDDYINSKKRYTRKSVRKAIAEQGYCLDKLVKDKDLDIRIAVAKQGYSLDILVNDDEWEVRRAVAEQGYGLDILINDEDPYVRAAIADQGYGLDKLINDESYYVRKAVARQGYGLDKLINDEDHTVRLIVARKGYGLDKLINDKRGVVRATAKMALKMLQNEA